MWVNAQDAKEFYSSQWKRRKRRWAILGNGAAQAPRKCEEAPMKHKVLMSIAVVVGAAALFPSLSAAQTSSEKTNVWTCMDLGGVELPLGDHEGHSITNGQWTCRVDSGPLAGGMATGTGVWEWDNHKGNEVTFSIVVRKPGALAVLRGTAGNMMLTMTEGKPTGMTGSGRYDYVLATGPWAPLAGKSETWANKYTSRTDFSVESTLQ
jgi:hypothetical protein